MQALVKRMTAAGMPEPQAEALAEEQVRLVSDRLATRRDLSDLREATKRDFEQFRELTKRDFDDFREATKRHIDELREATKRDIDELRQEVRRDLTDLATGLRSEMREMEHRITIRMGGMLAASVTLIAALVKLL